MARPREVALDGAFPTELTHTALADLAPTTVSSLAAKTPAANAPVKYSEALLDQSSPIHCKTAAEIFAAVAHLKSFSAASSSLCLLG